MWFPADTSPNAAAGAANAEICMLKILAAKVPKKTFFFMYTPPFSKMNDTLINDSHSEKATKLQNFFKERLKK